MKGIILAGGKGTRLGRHTIVLNKHLVAVGSYPMIEYPLSTLHRMGIKDIIIVTGAEHAGLIMNYLANAHPEIDFTYKVQKDAGGIAQALSLVENIVRGEKIAVILGDNIFDADFSSHSKEFADGNHGTMLFLKAVDDPCRFGVAEIAEGKISRIIEKPSSPNSNLAVTGLYFYDETVFDKIRTLKPSARGELEITDVNNMYVDENRAVYGLVPGFWSDAGTHLSRQHSEEFIKESKYDPLSSRVNNR